MRFLRPLLAAWIVCTPAVADEPIERVIDKHVNALIAKDAVLPAPFADDATLIRRLTLDLVGRIPTPAESSEYTASGDPDKKAKLVDRLMASPAYPRHQAAMFDAMLAAGSPKGSGTLRDYLNRALADNRPWDRIFRELLTPDESDPKQKGAGEYLKARMADTDKLTNEVSVAFFGVNVSCAQCHDHPLVNDWKQDHFYGMKAFFVRTIDNGGFVAERGFGRLKFKPLKGDEKVAKAYFLSSKVVELPNDREPTADETKQEKERLDKAKTAKQPAPPPAASARAKLVETALAEGNADFFAKSITNRLWHRFLGYGLVNPLDQMHSENPASHPELLDFLAKDVASHGYDLRRLTRGIVLSEAYARGSKYANEEQPDAKYFAVARLKPLTPMQLALSLKIATGDPDGYEKLKPEELEKKIEQLDGAARSFAAFIAMPGDDFQIGVNEALLFSNSGKVMQEFLGDAKGTLLGKLKDVQDDQAAIDLLVRSVLNRPVSSDESKLFADYVAKRGDRRPEAYRQLVWALLASSEFRFNH